MSSSLQLSPQPNSVTAKNPARAVKPFIAADARKLSSSRPRTRKAPKPTGQTRLHMRTDLPDLPTLDSPAELSPHAPAVLSAAQGRKLLSCSSAEGNATSR